MRDLTFLQASRLQDSAREQEALRWGFHSIEFYKVSVCRRLWSVVVTEEDVSPYGRVEHISFADWNIKTKRVPTWEEQCAMKDLFFKPEEECFCIFPRKSEYVNVVESCMHIWHKKEEA